jgi:hypothetical protein
VMMMNHGKNDQKTLMILLGKTRRKHLFIRRQQT